MLNGSFETAAALFSSTREKIAPLTPTNRRNSEHHSGHVERWETPMTTYFVATFLVALIVCAVLGAVNAGEVD